jgi:hypothetical protein
MRTFVTDRLLAAPGCRLIVEILVGPDRENDLVLVDDQDDLVIDDVHVEIVLVQLIHIDIEIAFDHCLELVVDYVVVCHGFLA